MVAARPLPVRFAGFRPLRRPPALLLSLAALLALAGWQAAEWRLGRLTHEAYPAMMRAAGTMQAAMAVLAAEKRRLGLLQPPEVDPNATGLIGPEFTDTTTSVGILDAKRTATNPDLAAALVRELAALAPPPGAPVGILVSGSLVGADIAAVAAVEALGLRPVLVSSLGASMFGATDPGFTWLDMEAALRERGVIAARSALAVIGGDRGMGTAMSEEGREALRAAAARHAVPLAGADTLEALVGLLQDHLLEEAGGPPVALINAGGAVVALGTCVEGDRIPSGLIAAPLPCSEGTEGLIGRFAAAGVPVLHLLNLRALALDWGLAYDPIPLPVPGNNGRLYGSPSPSAGDAS